MVFTIGDLWDELGGMGTRFKKSVVQRPAELKTGFLKIPSRYAFHVKRGAGMIGGYAGETVGAGTRALVTRGIGGVRTGLFPEKEFDPYAWAAKDPEYGIPSRPYQQIDLYTMFMHPERALVSAKGQAGALIPTKADIIQTGKETAGGLLPDWWGERPAMLDWAPPEIDLSQLGLGEGMSAFGAQLAGALGGIQPQITIPGMPKLTDEEGKISPAILIGAAAVGLGAVYLIGRK